MKKIYRMASLVIAVVIVLSMIAGTVLEAFAAEVYKPEITLVEIFYPESSGRGNESPKKLTAGQNYTVEITYFDNNISTDNVTILNGASEKGSIKIEDAGAFLASTSGITKVFLKSFQGADGQIYMKLRITNLKFINRSDSIAVSVNAVQSDTQSYETVYLSTSLPSKYNDGSSSGTSDPSPGGGGGGGGSVDTSTEYSSEIVVENVTVTDASGDRMDKVTKDSGRFNVSILYAEYGKGLRDFDYDDWDDDDMLEVYMTNTGSFMPSGGNRGTIKRTESSFADAPRFRVEFKNLTWDGASNVLNFQVRYNVDGAYIKGESSLAVYQARAKDESSEDESIPPPTPYIIVNHYSYGDGQIEAGNSFTLDLSFKNTSNDIPLENIVMTVTTPDDMSIASASNTYYINSIPAGGSMDYSLELQVKPNATVGSQSVQIAFSYQYLSKKERKENKTTENIAVPVTQIDRFSVDPITEIPAGLVGEAAYLNVSFINRGKTATYNITGYAKSNLEMISPAEHYGNLEAGKSDSIEVSLVPQEAGEMYGEIIIQYEDENTNQKEISVPFTMYVDKPYTPPPYTPPDVGAFEPPPENNLPTIIFCVVGGLLMTVPIALYLMKRVKAKGSEELDEDF